MLLFDFKVRNINFFFFISRVATLTEQHSELSAISCSIPAPSPASSKCWYVLGMSEAYKYLGDTLKKSVISSYCRHPSSHHSDKRSTQQFQWNKSKDFFLLQPHLLFGLTFKWSSKWSKAKYKVILQCMEKCPFIHKTDPAKWLLTYSKPYSKVGAHWENLLFSMQIWRLNYKATARL